MKDILILIPAYNPSIKLYDLVIELNQLGFSKILIIDDGSTIKSSRQVFKKLEAIESVIILSYPDNKGKGYALKYGINYYLENFHNDFLGLVTVDADYQHLPDDILNIALKLHGNLDSIVLGERNFNLKEIPFLNRLGNKLTALIFKLLYGNINDTQTGLRGFPNRYLNYALEAKGNKFEYEMNVLIKFTRLKIPIIKVPISTVYYQKSESKFKKISDSLRIYKVLFTEYLKFTFSSMISSIIDIGIFSGFILIFTNLNPDLAIVFATVIARLISGFINFNLNKNFVFLSHEKDNILLYKYYLLCMINMALSAILVLGFHKLFPNVFDAIFKVIVDIVIYFISYKIQKKYIFKT